VILGYFEDGPNLVTLAMNGWADGEPAWWLNLQEDPGASVDLADGSCTVTARAAVGAERSRRYLGPRSSDETSATPGTRSTVTQRTRGCAPNVER